MINLQSRAWPATIAAALLLVEALVVFSLAIYLVVQNFIADNVDDRHALLGEIIYASFGAAIIFLLSWSFYTNRRFGRAPAILLNLIFLGVSTYMFSESLLLLGLVTFVISGCTVAAAISVIPEE